MRILASLLAIPAKLSPRKSNNQKGGKDSNGRLCQNSLSEGICARLILLVSSRHKGPALNVVRTNQTAATAVPVTAAICSRSGLRDCVGVEVCGLVSAIVTRRNQHISSREATATAELISSRGGRGGRISHFSTPGSAGILACVDARSGWATGISKSF